MNVDILLIGSGNMGRGYLEAARHLGLQVAVIETETRIGTIRSEFADVVTAHEVVDPAAAEHDEAWVGPALTLARRTAPRGVLGFSETHVVASALVADELRLPGPGMYAAQASRNKALQRQLYGLAGVPQPSSRIVPALTLEPQPCLPVVLKPFSGAGSHGVEQVPDETAWRDAVARTAGIGPLLIEDYATGDEYSWEALLLGGQVLFTNLTAKTTTGPPHFVELLHRPVIGEAGHCLRDQADQLGARVVSALRARDGMVHLEFRRASDGSVAVMETAVRTPGDYLMDVVSQAHGVDLYAACLLIALGEKPKLLHRELRYTASLYLAAECAGTAVPDDASRLNAVQGVFRSGLCRPPGSGAGPPESSADRMAFALLNLPCEKALDEAVRQARRAFAKDG
ncbi:acetyl-CoA carboxylase biotin carboxylase subunit family protein [Streptomyces sp. NPDC090029]|uniref:ATP-grasp domain-containing protein n=1 Tax=Streptomyces sp. NPDC090029 TaxID=3365924 RepID=UPI00381FACFC